MLSGAALAGTILTAGFAMFPFVMPSSTVPNASLTVYDAVSSHRTLNLMFVAVVLFLPIVLALHELGLPRAAGQGDREADSGGNAFGVLSLQAEERTRAMPHVIVKLYPGRTEEQKRRLSDFL